VYVTLHINFGLIFHLLKARYRGCAPVPHMFPVLVNRVPACLAGVKAGCVHLCRVTGNTM